MHGGTIWGGMAVIAELNVKMDVVTAVRMGIFWWYHPYRSFSTYVTPPIGTLILKTY